MQAFASLLASRLDADAGRDPGRPLLHRLNRTEYRNAIRDLLDLDVDTEKLLPVDNVTQGFDNMSEALTVTPTLMDAYASAPGKIPASRRRRSRRVGDGGYVPAADEFLADPPCRRHAAGNARRDRRALQLSGRCRVLFKASLVFTRNTFLFGSTVAGEQLEIAVDGTRVALFDINPIDEGGRQQPGDHTGQGRRPDPHTISAAFVDKNDGPIDDFLRRPERALGDDFVGQTPGLTGLPHLREFGVEGPYNVTRRRRHAEPPTDLRLPPDAPGR